MDDPADEAEEFEWRGKRRGRPPGVPNRAPIVKQVTENTARNTSRVRMPDISEMIARQLKIVSAMQDHIEAKIGTEKGASMNDVCDLSAALDKAMAAVSRATKAEEDVLSRMSAAQHLEAAIRRVEEQDIGTILHIIRRLKTASEKPIASGPVTAADAIRALGDE